MSGVKVQKDDLFRVSTNQGTLDSSSLVIATGGLSIAPLGATDFGYQIARQFGWGLKSQDPGWCRSRCRPKC